MRPLTLAVLAVSLALSAPALAAQCDPDDESQSGMNICAAEEYEAADKALNQAYHEVVKRLEDSPEDKKLLLTAQRAWIAFRDAECAFSTSDSIGGSIHPMLVSGCLTELTKARTEQLGAYTECEEGDVTCLPQSAE